MSVNSTSNTLKVIFCSLFFYTTVGASANLHAASLVGQNVFGILNLDGNSTNLFDPSNIGLSQNALNEISNPVTISSTQFEFTYVNNGINGIFVDFTDNGLAISNDAVTTPFSSWTMSFTSASFNGLELTKLVDGFNNGGVNSSIVGDTINFSWLGTNTGSINATAEFSLQAVPVPGAYILFTSGLLFMINLSRKPKRSYKT